MTAKEWLERGQAVNKEIETLNSLRLSALENATSTTAQLSSERVQSCGNSSENKFVNYCAYVEEVCVEMDKKYAIKREINNVISKMTDVQIKVLLREKYLNGKEGYELETILNRDRTSIYRKLQKAFEEVERILISEGVI